MQAVRIMMFLMCINAAFFLLSVSGLYFNTPGYDLLEDWGAVDVVLIFAGNFLSAAIVGLILARFGVDPFKSAAYIAFLGMFITLYYGFVKVLFNIRNMMGPATPIMDGFIVIMTMVMAVLVYYSCLQMAVGGAKSYE